MTDETKAEQYAVENWEHYESGQTDYKALKQAFLGGLQAGRPQWHDLRKNQMICRIICVLSGLMSVQVIMMKMAGGVVSEGYKMSLLGVNQSLRSKPCLNKK